MAANKEATKKEPPSDEARAVGARLRAAREALGLSGEKAGESVDVTKSAVSQWEAGSTLPDLLTFRKYCAQVLKVSADQMLYGKAGAVKLRDDDELELLEDFRFLLGGDRQRLLHQVRDMATAAKATTLEVLQRLNITGSVSATRAHEQLSVEKKKQDPEKAPPAKTLKRPRKR